jgi:ABC-type nickel/cobalt efflux system permease component RcnA
MWIIGLLLLAASVVVGIEIGISNDQQIDVEAFNEVWTSNPAAAFLVGVATALVGALGLWLMFTSLRRSRVRRRERRAEMAERDRLADERRRELETVAAAKHGHPDDRTVDDRTVDDRTVDDRTVATDDRDSIDLREQQEFEHGDRRGILHHSER